LRVSEVFKFSALDHVRNHPRWNANIMLEQITNGPIAVGTLIRKANIRYGAPVVEISK
jgi:hypothetical protein